MYDWYICFIYVYTLHLMLLLSKCYKYLYVSSSFCFKN